jgi:hypothetical protein
VTHGSEKTFVINELATGCCSLHPLQHIDFQITEEARESLQAPGVPRFFLSSTFCCAPLRSACSREASLSGGRGTKQHTSLTWQASVRPARKRLRARWTRDFAPGLEAFDDERFLAAVADHRQRVLREMPQRGL